MSYKHLAGRLIETQRSMLGKSALNIARSVEGISVGDNGSVTAVAGDGHAAVETLAQRYIEVMGSAAEDRLLAAAEEFEGDLILPPSLGGPEEYADAARDPSAPKTTAGDTDPTAADSSAGAFSDGGTVAFQSPVDTDDATGAESSEPTARTQAEEALQEVSSIPKPVKVEYTVASSIPDVGDGDTDLGSVYLMSLDDDDWQAPVSVADAVRDALSDATDLSDDGIDAFVDALDPDRLLATFDGENGETVSSHLEGITVTFHRTGSLAVH
jgi:hypothetical protein